VQRNDFVVNNSRMSIDRPAKKTVYAKVVYAKVLWTTLRI